MITSCTYKQDNHSTLPWAVELKYTAYQGGGGIYALMLSRLYIITRPGCLLVVGRTAGL